MLDPNILWAMVAGAILAFPLGWYVGHSISMFYMARINNSFRRALARTMDQLTDCQRDREELARRLQEAEDQKAM